MSPANVCFVCLWAFHDGPLRMTLIDDAKQAEKSGPVETGLTEPAATACNAIMTSSWYNIWLTERKHGSSCILENGDETRTWYINV